MPPSTDRLLPFLRRPWHDKVNLLHAFLVQLKTALYYRVIFGSVGRGSLIYKPLLLSNPRFVYVGDRTLIRSGARIETVVLDESRPPKLIIGNNVNIEQNVHLICSSRLEIGDNVSITGHSAIVDTSHPYAEVNDSRKIGDRIDPHPTPVSIGENSFLGFGSIVLPGVAIGKHCVVGANSTVTTNIPDYSIAAGNPARVLKRYDPVEMRWISHSE